MLRSFFSLLPLGKFSSPRLTTQHGVCADQPLPSIPFILPSPGFYLQNEGRPPQPFGLHDPSHPAPPHPCHPPSFPQEVFISGNLLNYSHSCASIITVHFRTFSITPERDPTDLLSTPSAGCHHKFLVSSNPRPPLTCFLSLSMCLFLPFLTLLSSVLWYQPGLD